MATRGDALQQGRALSHRASRLVWLRSGIGAKPSLIGLKAGPVDKAGMMLGNENGPLADGQMSHSHFDAAVFIDVAFAPGLAIGVSASINRIGQDVVQRGVGWSDPADRTRLARGSMLQRKGQAFGAKPEPHAPRRTELGEALEDGADGAGHRFVGMEQDFTIGLSPYETHGQTATQLPARGLVADTSVQSCANDVQLGFAHRAL